jgi:hypothetical protein
VGTNLGRSSGPRIALWDIETAPSLGYFWGKLWETDIIGVKSPWYILCFSYKWLGESKIHTHALPDYKHYKDDKENDAGLIADLHRLFDEAQILIAHNGDKFDGRKAMARFIFHGHKPPSPVRTIDTLKEARKHFLFDSNRLSDLGQYLQVGKKLPNTGFDLWKRCMLGDAEAWDMMRRYNRRDVVLLERVYERLRPYMSNHPNLGVYSAAGCCPACRSERLQKRGEAVTRSRKYQGIQCRDCGHWTRGELIK